MGSCDVETRPRPEMVWSPARAVLDYPVHARVCAYLIGTAGHCAAKYASYPIPLHRIIPTCNVMKRPLGHEADLTYVAMAYYGKVLLKNANAAYTAHLAGAGVWYWRSTGGECMVLCIRRQYDSKEVDRVERHQAF